MISSPPRPVPKLYENFVEEIDAIDNGIAQTDGEPRYALTTNLSARVGHLNPRWNDPDQDTEVGTRGKGGDAELRSLGSPLTLLLRPQAGFKRAMELVGSEFMDRLDYYHRAWLPARALVEDAIRRRFEVLPMLVLGGLKGGWSPGAGGGQVPLVLTLPHSSGHGSAPHLSLCTLIATCTPLYAPL